MTEPTETTFAWRTTPTALLTPPDGPIAMRAIYDDTVVAQTERPVVYECRAYFPADDVDFSRPELSGTYTFCPWTDFAD